MKIKNYTEHPLHLYKKSQCTYDNSGKKWIVKEGEKPIKTYPIERVLRAPVTDDLQQSVQLSGTDVMLDVLKRKLVNPDPSPVPDSGTLHIASLLYVGTLKANGQSVEGLYTVETCWGKMPNGSLGVVGFVAVIAA